MPRPAARCARFLASFLAVLLPLVEAAASPLPGDALEDLLDGVLGRFDVESLKPGFGICLFDVRGPIWSRYEGSADLEGRKPFSPDTRFRVGAVSELVTAVRALQLVDEGKMELDAPIARYAPEVFAPAAPGSALGSFGELEVGTLLSQLAGAPADYFLRFRGYDPFRNIGSFLKDASRTFPPGAAYIHAGAFIDLLGVAIQERSGLTFERSVREAIFEPLGMGSSSFRYSDDPRNSVMHYKSGQVDGYLTTIADWNETMAPSGSMMSTLRDLTAFYSMLLAQGSWAGRSILSPGSVEAMLSPKSDEAARRQGISVGYVWMLSLPELAHLGDVAWYSGKFIAHRNAVILAVDLGVGVAVATNKWRMSDRDTIFPLATEILNTYAGAALGKVVVEPDAGKAQPLPTALGRAIEGSFVSPFGIHRVSVGKEGIAVFSNGEERRLDYRGGALFIPKEPCDIQRAVFSEPDTLTLWMRNGIVASGTRTGVPDSASAWTGELGTFRIADRSDYEKVHVYAFSLGIRDGLLVIQGDDAREYCALPFSGTTARIVCHEASPFAGKSLEVKDDARLFLGGVPFTLAFRARQ